MRLRRRTAARIISEARDQNRSLTAEEKAYLSNHDQQDLKAGRKPVRTLAETGALYLKSRDEVGLPWSATGKELAEARATKGVVKSRKVNTGPAFTAADIPARENFPNQGAFLRAAREFKSKYGVKVADARKQVGSAPAPVPAATLTLDVSTLNDAQREALRLLGLLDPR